MAQPAHYQYTAAPDTHHQQQPLYAAQQYGHHTNDTYSGAPSSRRLPSVSELLVSQQNTPQQQQQTMVASPVRESAPYTPLFAQPDRLSHHQHQHQHQQGLTGSYVATPSYAVEPLKSLGIDVPKHHSAHDAASYHRDSESASSVSSQGTLVDNYSPQAHQTFAFKLQQKQQQYISSSTDHSMYEDDVFTAASILMSLRTCKMPC
ncbi:hypothetical protein BX070DRAFT_237302 [Coemansia spiralis]|nr:hypothetical protein BX070DRAFT_237302 [Coemansia spiralis]